MLIPEHQHRASAAQGIISTGHQQQGPVLIPEKALCGRELVHSQDSRLEMDWACPSMHAGSHRQGGTDRGAQTGSHRQGGTSSHRGHGTSVAADMGRSCERPSQAAVILPGSSHAPRQQQGGGHARPCNSQQAWPGCSGMARVLWDGQDAVGMGACLELDACECRGFQG